MLTIRQDLVDAMVAHARADHPDEACGVIAGPAGSDRPERFIPMVNAARSPLRSPISLKSCKVTFPGSTACSGTVGFAVRHALMNSPTTHNRATVNFVFMVQFNFVAVAPAVGCQARVKGL